MACFQKFRQNEPVHELTKLSEYSEDDFPSLWILLRMGENEQKYETMDEI